MHIYRRNGILYTRIKHLDGRWRAHTLATTDRKAAEVRARDLERRLVNPPDPTQNETSFAAAADDFMISRQVKGCAPGTLSMYTQKLAHLARLLGPQLALARLGREGARLVDGYIVTRLNEGAHRNTIGKELTTLRGVLKVAKRAKKFPFDLGEVLPVEWSNDYEPRRTSLTPAQVDALVAHLAAERRVEVESKRTVRPRGAWTWVGRLDETKRANRAAFVAFLVATGARLSEGLRATRDQIDLQRCLVYFRITKTRKKGKREKFVPVTRLTRPLLEYVLAATGDGVMFTRWGNITRDLARACSELGIPRVTANDLRRTHANWLVNAGVDTHLVANVLGHVDSRMVEKVYGRLRPEQLRDRVMEMVH